MFFRNQESLPRHSPERPDRRSGGTSCSGKQSLQGITAFSISVDVATKLRLRVWGWLGSKGCRNCLFPGNLADTLADRNNPMTKYTGSKRLMPLLDAFFTSRVLRFEVMKSKFSPTHASLKVAASLAAAF